MRLVALGGDIGIYALARAAHEANGTLTTVLSPVVSNAIKHSRIVKWHRVASLEDENLLVGELLKVAATHAGEKLILLANDEAWVRILQRNWDALSPSYRFPRVPLEVLTEITDKHTFGQICQQLDIPTPQTTVVSPTDLQEKDLQKLARSFDYPLVAKPNASAEYHYVDFPGKQKIFHFSSPEQSEELLTNLRNVQYPGAFLFQEEIPGDDTYIGSLSLYRDRGGQVSVACSGRVLLEEYTPGTLGIPAAILTTNFERALAQAAAFLEHIDYWGFANFDFKTHAKTGRQYFFEVNARMGRNNYYVTAAGINYSEQIMADLGEQPAPQARENFDEILYSVVPRRLLLKYLPDPELREKVKSLARAGKMFNPLKYRADLSLKRRIHLWLLGLNQYRKYRTHYPAD